VTSLSHQKEKLERQKARLQSKEQKLKTLERKHRTRRLIELGGLIVKAELDALNNNILLGALLSIKQQMTNNETIIHEWTEQGARAFEAQNPTTESGSNTAPLVITFKTEPPRELKSQLRDLNFKWNPFRKEWYGYGDMNALSRLTQHHGAVVELCGD
jgi:hypothetical protein